ncbi:outer membrane protein assembly factor BamA [Wenzhouxiangella marina]|uniref:Outer membrane protein assembly factor BamA n=1 Tax=Wenzhouxiangella marina TaxID=1579979 RepID=A0A0K0XT70_9GAMM|nr:outer membrane protein assembly factor BamA [Wenzhouxiangella marina]AKS40816.1 Outer membrane protein assembly factor BamA [Wenzhouxiangella marina]MBB6087690.1 outer membrane protein insertion porin family [Wenzhouxiangella marina]
MNKLCLLLLLSVLAAPLAADTFRIDDIRVDGLQRISEGNVFSFIPVEVGDTMNPAMSRATIRDLFRTGFFDDITLTREGNVLVITVEERPAISDIAIAGNRQIKTEDLMPALAGIGISEGEIFNQLELDRVQQELVRQYHSRGHYAAEVDARVTRLARNRVNLSIFIDEGKQARIRHINIVGNESFDEDELRDDFESHDRRSLYFWRDNHRYTREKLSGDLESLRSYYLDRGYIDFAIESTQVSISPDKQDIYITANVREGEVYRISDVQLTGELILPEETLRRLIRVEPGDTFSRRDMESSMEGITALLSNIGYAFANVNPMPRVDRDTREVSLTFFIEPGKRVYVRRINFTGNTQTKDEVLRREMRQFEGAWFSQLALDRSRQRLERLGYFDNVNFETTPVDGSDDQVDIMVSVEEQPSGSFQVGLGYSQFQGIILSVAVEQDNFLGSGRKVGFSVQRSRILTQAGFSYTNPYFTDDGVSAGYFLRYSEFDTLGRSSNNIASFSTSQAAAGLNFGFPVTELDFLRFGASAQRVDINLPGFFGPPPENPDAPIEEWILQIPGDRPLGISLDEDGDGLLSSSERRITTFRLDGTWSRDSRNHYLNPTRGSLNRLTAEVALPGSTREFFKLSYRFRKYWPIGDTWALGLRGDLSYGDAYDNYDAELGIEPIDPEIVEGNRRTCLIDEVVTFDAGLPFYEHYYGGGVSDIRGFDDNSLGPKDQFCRSVGGDLKVAAGLELAFPLPFVESSGTRLALFIDAGNVYRDWDSFDTDLIRASAGIALTWRAPVGPIIINLARPIRKLDGDDTQSLQFTFGQFF